MECQSTMEIKKEINYEEQMILNKDKAQRIYAWQVSGYRQFQSLIAKNKILNTF